MKRICRYSKCNKNSTTDNVEKMRINKREFLKFKMERFCRELEYRKLSNKEIYSSNFTWLTYMNSLMRYKNIYVIRLYHLTS